MRARACICVCSCACACLGTCAVRVRVCVGARVCVCVCRTSTPIDPKLRADDDVRLKNGDCKRALVVRVGMRVRVCARREFVCLLVFVRARGRACSIAAGTKSALVMRLYLPRGRTSAGSAVPVPGWRLPCGPRRCAAGCAASAVRRVATLAVRSAGALTMG